MLGRITLSLLVAGIAVAAIWDPVPESVQAIEPTTPGFQDSDGDFLPDSVEWAVLTSAANADTDSDQIADFIEVVQGGRPRHPSEPLPMDQEMRLVITGPQPGTGNQTTWLHLFFRLVEPSTPIQAFSSWIELPQMPGIRIHFDILSLGAVVFRERNAGAEGHWISLSVPLVGMSLLQAILPCSFCSEAMLGGRHVRSGVSLFNVAGMVSTLVAYDSDHFAVQTIAPMAGTGMESNRVCLLDLQEVGSGPGGTVYEVVDAFCDDCCELECAPTCPQSIGWIITIPGGLGGNGNQD